MSATSSRPTTGISPRCPDSRSTTRISPRLPPAAITAAMASAPSTTTSRHALRHDRGDLAHCCRVTTTTKSHLAHSTRYALPAESAEHTDAGLFDELHDPVCDLLAHFTQSCKKVRSHRLDLPSARCAQPATRLSPEQTQLLLPAPDDFRDAAWQNLHINCQVCLLHPLDHPVWTSRSA